ncbi:MAG: gamma-glutamyl-gamma-aminobutyrate hydrolase family protein [Candidatus Rifleibacteriota bacterium]
MKKRPVIGIAYSDSSVRDSQMRIRTYVSRKYYRSVFMADGLPVLLPTIDPNFNNRLAGENNLDFPESYDHILEQYLNMVDAVILAGGEDVDPRFQNEDPHPDIDLVNPFRDEFELALTRAVFNRKFTGRKLPVLGICRGIQVMTIALGGKIHQDIKNIQKLQHSQRAPRWATTHKIKIESSTRLAEIMQNSEIFTNSFHHQSVKDVPDGFKVSAQSSDGIIEAMEFSGDHFMLGVQWHPEETSETDRFSAQLFKGFVAAAKNN